MYPLLVVWSELVFPGSGRGCWSMVAVVLNRYKQQQGERRREAPPNLLGRLQQMGNSSYKQMLAVWERL